MNFFSSKKQIRAYLLELGMDKCEIALVTRFIFDGSIPEAEISSQSNKAALQNLIKQDLVVFDKIGKKYDLKSVSYFVQWINGHTKNIVKKINHRMNHFVDIIENFNKFNQKIKVEFYEGTEGIKESYRHILENAKDNICSYYSVVETEQSGLQAFFEDEYVVERAKRKIFARNVAPRTPKSLYYKLRSPEVFSETRLISPEFFPSLNSEINLYGDFMHTMTFDQNGGMATIFQSKDIVVLQKALFEIAWNAANTFPYRVTLGDVPQTLDMKNMVEKGQVYLTDNFEEVLGRLDSRKDRFTNDLPTKFPNSKPEYIKTKDGEHILKICDLEVMSDFQAPYMKKLAEIVTMHGGKILNVGFGLGLADTFIQEYSEIRTVNEHHIVEINESVYKNACAWREKQKNKDKIFIYHSSWEDLIPQLAEKKMVFDGVLYDGYPLRLEDVCRDSVPFIYPLIRYKLIKEYDGILTFFMDSTNGFGDSFQNYALELGIHEMNVKKVPNPLPDRFHEHWKKPFFLAPILTDIRY
jgi:hypothetical protein